MKAILLSAGYATRLYPLTLDKPKALLDVNGRPVIEHIVDKISKIENVDEIIIVTNNKFYDNFAEWKMACECKKPLFIINDNTNNNEERLGAIGDINFAIEERKIDDDAIIVNSDNLFSFNLNEIYEYFILNSDTIGMFDVGSLDIARKMGNPLLDKENRIVLFKEKDQDTKSSLCSVGIYLFSRSTMKLFYKYLSEGNSPDKSGEFVEWLYKRNPVYGYVFDNKREYWFDIGSKEDYNNACEYLSGLMEIDKMKILHNQDESEK
ncbi:MAG: nucleotidyltransferase family protein [Nanoarchaeota archaeon]